MNERIRELAKQAGLLGPSSRVGNSHEATEKFAELIVRECAVIADQEGPNYVGCGYITKTKGMLIKEHFGVEE